jgi:hypothetical protein
MQSSRLGRCAIQAVLVCVAGVAVAQGPPGRDRDNPPPGHGGVPPGQAKKHGDDGRGMPPGQAKKYGDDGRGMPPGQAKKYGEDGRGMPPGQAKKYGNFRFRDQDRREFYAHYRGDADRWRGHRRPVFVPGEVIARTYYVQPVPRTYWVNVAPPPPPGYQYGYYEGYVVAYDPTTRVIADVLDLVAAASGR